MLKRTGRPMGPWSQAVRWEPLREQRLPPRALRAEPVLTVQ